MAADRVLVDTSLLVAASVVPHPGHEAANGYLDRLKVEGSSLCISPQICREFMVVLSRQPVSGVHFTNEDALAALDRWMSVATLLEENELVVEKWRSLAIKFQVRGKALHDCNLVAVMLTHGVTRIGTRNASDFARYDEEVTVEPVAP